MHLEHKNIINELNTHQRFMIKYFKDFIMLLYDLTLENDLKKNHCIKNFHMIQSVVVVDINIVTRQNGCDTIEYRFHNQVDLLRHQ